MSDYPQRHVRHDFGFLAADCRDGRARLPVEIYKVKFVEIGDVKSAHAKPRETQQVWPPNSAQAGDGNGLSLESTLVRFCEPSEIASESV